MITLDEQISCAIMRMRGRMSPEIYGLEAGEMEVASVCVKCQNKNVHEVDHNGQATVTCPSCQEVYDVKTYQVRAKGGNELWRKSFLLAVR